MTRILRDTNRPDWLRALAVDELGDINGEDVEQTLVEALSDKDQDVRWAARDALVDGIVFRKFKSDPKVLVAILEDGSRSMPVRAKAADLLANFVEHEFVKQALEKAAEKDPEKDVRDTAKLALNQD